MIGVKLSGEKGLSNTTSLMLRSVWERAESLPPELGSRIADSILDVFATSCTEVSGRTVITFETITSAAFMAFTPVSINGIRP